MSETIFMQPVILSPEVKAQRKKKLDVAILEAIDESLSSFGDSVKQAIYDQLEKQYHLRKREIPSKIEDFVTAIEGIFGVGARLIEMKILEALYARTRGFAYFPDGEDLVFKDYVQSIRVFLGNSATS